MASNSSITSKFLPDFEMHNRAERCIAQGYLTNSKRPQSLVKGVYPTHLKRGRDCYVWDHKGRKYVDFITGLGTNLLGYANEQVAKAATSAMMDGNLLSLAMEQEILTAEKLKEVFPFVDLWKFVKTGSDATSAAVRIARSVRPGRDTVMSDGYHGTHDGFVSLTPPAYGVVGDHNYRKLDVSKISSDTAAVIIEPIITDLSPARIIEVKAIQQACRIHGALLTFDEVITGFRFPKFSFSEYSGITPDLICIGKAMANGFSLAAVGGKISVMNHAEYFYSSTYASSADALAACWKVVDLLQKDYKIAEVWEKGQRFLDEFNKFWPEKIKIEGYPTRGGFKGDDMVRALFFQEACLAGFLVGPGFWINFPLLKELDNALDVFGQIVRKIRLGDVALIGEMPRSPFAQKVRDGN